MTDHICVIVQLFSWNKERQWQSVHSQVIVKDPVYDVAFAPNFGQSFDKLAVAIASGVKVFSLQQQRGEQQHEDTGGVHNLFVSRMAEFPLEAIVWRLDWDFMGSSFVS